MNRREAAIVTNTVAISTCNDGIFTVNYQWNMNSSLAFQPVFPNGGNGVRHWPEQPHLYSNVLFTVLAQSVSTGNGPLDFTVQGATLSRVTNFGVNSSQWTVDQLPLYTGPMLLGHGSVVDEGYLYLFAYHQANTYLARLRLDPLLNPQVRNARPHLEYYSRSSSSWKPGLTVSDMTPLGINASGGSTIFYNPRVKKWQMVYHDTTVFGGADIVTRTASSFNGTWSAPRVVYRIPQRVEGNPNYREDLFCYTGFHHPEFTDRRESRALVISYVCNGLEGETNLNDNDVYRVKTVRVPNPW